MSDNDDSDDEKTAGKLLTFPGGKKVNTSDIGADFIVGQSGHIPTPELLDPIQVEKEYKERNQFIRNQKIVQVVEQNASTADMINALLLEISEETAHLKFEREKVAKSGKSTATYNVARITTLRSLADLLLKRKEYDLSEKLDFKSERFQKIFTIWMQFLYESMEKSGVTADVIDLVFKQMQADMEEWETRMSAC